MTILDWSEFVEEGRINIGTIVACLFLAAWTGLCSFISYCFWHVAHRRRYLAERGQPARGFVTSRWQNVGEAVSSYITYQFVSPAGDPITARYRVDDKKFPSILPGDPVTVLFDPAKPKRSLPYELSEFEIVDSLG